MVNDTNKFVELPTCNDPTKERENKLQGYLYRFKRKGALDKSTYERLRPTESSPARI